MDKFILLSMGAVLAAAALILIANFQHDDVEKPYIVTHLESGYEDSFRCPPAFESLQSVISFLDNAKGGGTFIIDFKGELLAVQVPGEIPEWYFSECFNDISYPGSKEGE